MAWAGQAAWWLSAALASAVVPLFLNVLLVSRSASAKARARLWSSLDVVGISGRSIFSWTWAVLASLTSTARWARDGYARFSRGPGGRPFGMPSLWTGRAVVVLPPSLLPSVLGRPETELAAHRAQLDTIQLPYMMTDADVYDNPIHYDVVRRSMSRRDVGTLAAATNAELRAAFAAYWPTTASSSGASDGWVTLNNWDACGKVLTRAAMLALVGPPLCRDERLLEWARQYATAVITGTAFINCLPPAVRPYLGPAFGLRAKYFQARCLRVMVPLIRDRIRQHGQGTSSSNGGGDSDDFLQATIARCARAGPDQLDPRRIAMRLLGLATMSIMGMVYVLTHCVADLYGGSPEEQPERDGVLAALEAECVRAAAAESDDGGGGGGGLGSKEVLDGLVHVDSALRESMRLSNISVTSLARDVVAEAMDIHIPAPPDGPEVAYRIPRGTRVVFPTQDMHRDEAVFKNPSRFDALRFSRSPGGGGVDRDAVASTTCSPSFLAFGYGRHACPGRFYAVQTLKQALAHIVLNYDVELVGEGRPREKQTLLNVNVPQTDLRIRVRRKQGVKAAAQ